MNVGVGPIELLIIFLFLTGFVPLPVLAVLLVIGLGLFGA